MPPQLLHKRRVHLAKERSGNCSQGILVGDTQSLNENRCDIHPLEHARDLDTASVNHHSSRCRHTPNFCDSLDRIFKEHASYFDDCCHESSPAVGSHPNMRLRF